jgi:hypothetical protein
LILVKNEYIVPAPKHKEIKRGLLLEIIAEVADKNLTIGLCLVVFGVLFGTTSYFVLGNVPLTALGMGLAVLGAAWAMIPSNPLPRETVASLIKSSVQLIAAPSGPSLLAENA